MLESADAKVPGEQRDAFLLGFVDLYQNASEALTNVREMQEAAEGMYGVSSTLRKPLKVMNSGLRSVRDSEQIMRSWSERASELLREYPPEAES
jgi:hypothetical protein